MGRRDRDYSHNRLPPYFSHSETKRWKAEKWDSTLREILLGNEFLNTRLENWLSGGRNLSGSPEAT